MKGGHLKVGFNTLVCEKGLEHEDWVKFDQIKQCWYGKSDIHGGTTRFWREIACMEVVALMSGAQGEEAHQEYKEGDNIHCGDDGIIILLMVCLDLLLSSTI